MVQCVNDRVGGRGTPTFASLNKDVLSYTPLRFFFDQAILYALGFMVWMHLDISIITLLCEDDRVLFFEARFYLLLCWYKQRKKITKYCVVH